MGLFENGLMKGPEIAYVDHHSFVTAGCNNMNQLSAKIEHGIQGKKRCSVYSKTSLRHVVVYHLLKIRNAF